MTREEDMGVECKQGNVERCERRGRKGIKGEEESDSGRTYKIQERKCVRGGEKREKGG